MWTGGVDLLPHELTTMEHAATVAAMAIAQERSVLVERAAPPHAAAHAARLAPAGRPRRDRALGDGDGLGHGPRAGGRPRRAVRRRRASASAVAGQPVEDRLVRAAQDAVSSQPIVWALRSGLALLVEPRPSLRPGRARPARRAAARRRRRGRDGGRGRVAAGRRRRSGAATRRPRRRSRLGRELSGHDFVLEHEELGVYRLLSRLPLDELRRHRAEAIGPLLEYDRDHNGALVHTLEVFLRCERNRVQGGRGAVHPLQHAALPARADRPAHRRAERRLDRAPEPRARAVRPPARPRARGGLSGQPRRRGARPSCRRTRPSRCGRRRTPRAADGRAARRASRCARRRGRGGRR